MCHGIKKTNKDIRFKTDTPRHKNAIPYKRLVKHKKDFRYYED